MPYKLVAPDVYYASEPLLALGEDALAFLREKANASPNHRARICAHPDPGDSLHQMLVALRRGAYIRPHRHPGKSESFHMIEGRLAIAVFNDAGDMDGHVDLSAPGGERPFVYRMSRSRFHTVLPETDLVIFHEITNGPFDRNDTIFADWSPEEDDLDGGRRFVDQVSQRLGQDPL